MVAKSCGSSITISKMTSLDKALISSMNYSHRIRSSLEETSFVASIISNNMFMHHSSSKRMAFIKSALEVTSDSNARQTSCILHTNGLKCHKLLKSAICVFLGIIFPIAKVMSELDTIVGKVTCKILIRSVINN